MNKKILIVIIAIVIAVSIGIASFFIWSKTPNGQFSSKLDNLENMYKQSNKRDRNDKTVIISISDRKTKAVVKSETARTLSEAYDKAKREIKKYIKENNYNADWIKFEVIDSKKEMKKRDFRIEFLCYKKDYTYRKGLILNYDNRNIILTEAELNANKILDYDSYDLNLDKLNEYLKKIGQEQVKYLADDVTTFTTKAYFCDENGKCYELYNEGEDTGRRKLSSINKEDIQYIINNSINYLSNMVQENGMFIYGYNPLTGKNLSSYNILRHAGSTWALIKCDNSNRNLRKSEMAMNYLNSQINKKSEDLYFVVEDKDDELKLGASALSAIAMCEYTEKFDSSKYIETIKKLGNGIISLQNENGSYTHVLNEKDYSVVDENRTVYYDGEATLALCRIYDITKEEKYLDAAKKAIQYFIDNNYIQYADHWISYAVNEIVKYENDIKYYEFGLKNVAENIEMISNLNITSHTKFEMIMQCFELYRKIKENNIDVPYMSQFPEERFLKLVKEKFDFQLNSYMYPELAMYLDNPSKYLDTFFIRNSSFRIRIDDIQHSVLGFYEYLKNFDKIN